MTLPSSGEAAETRLIHKTTNTRRVHNRRQEASYKETLRLVVRGNNTQHSRGYNRKAAAQRRQAHSRQE